MGYYESYMAEKLVPQLAEERRRGVELARMRKQARLQVKADSVTDVGRTTDRVHRSHRWFPVHVPSLHRGPHVA
jgi:hypothetical protein